MFGSTAYVHVPRGERGSWTPKPRSVSYLDIKTCRKDIYYHVTRKALYSRNVKFNEQKMEGPRFEEEGACKSASIFWTQRMSLNQTREELRKRSDLMQIHLLPTPPPSPTEDCQRETTGEVLRFSASSHHCTPASLKKATACPEGEQWKQAMG